MRDAREALAMCDTRAREAPVSLEKEAEQVLGAEHALDELAVEVGQLERVLVGRLAAGSKALACAQQALLPRTLLLLVLEYELIDLASIRAYQIQRVLTTAAVVVCGEGGEAIYRARRVSRRRVERTRRRGGVGVEALLDRVALHEHRVLVVVVVALELADNERLVEEEEGARARHPLALVDRLDAQLVVAYVLAVLLERGEGVRRRLVARVADCRRRRRLEERREVGASCVATATATATAVHDLDHLVDLAHVLLVALALVEVLAELEHRVARLLDALLGRVLHVRLLEQLAEQQVILEHSLVRQTQQIRQLDSSNQ